MSKKQKKDPPLVCIYPQEAWHDDVFVVGNRDGLLALQRAVARALETGKSSEEVFVTDGEGYNVKVLLNDDDWLSDSWRKLALPYTADYTGEMAPSVNDNVVYPGEL